MLRPAFTQKLAERVLAGECINLIGAHGSGRRQTLTDLSSLLTGHMRILTADMKFTADDYPGTLATLCQQADIPATDFATLLSQIGEAKISRPTLLVLHNADLLRNAAHDPRFDRELLPHLASIAKYPAMALLTVCETEYADWKLPCNNLPLPSPAESD